MTTPESLGLIDALEAQNTRSVKRARQTVWGSVAVALVVLLFLIVSASLQLLSVKRDVKAAEIQLGAQQRALQDVERIRLSAERSLAQAVEQQKAAERARDEAEAERSSAQKEAESFRRIVQNVPKEEVLKAVTTAQAKAPGKPLAPRIYAQIVREQDRAYATRVSRKRHDRRATIAGSPSPDVLARLAHQET
jgi:cell division protein FtsL